MQVHQAARLAAVAVLLVSMTGAGAGCYGYAYHRRGPGPSFGKVAIDEHKPEKKVCWSLFWGLKREEWLPVACAPGEKGPACKPVADVCGGKGAGRVEVKFVWYSALTMIGTLGLAVPNQVTIYCSTEEGPDTDPFAEGPG